MEKNYTDEAIAGDNETIKLAIKALLEVRSQRYCTHKNITWPVYLVQNAFKGGPDSDRLNRSLIFLVQDRPTVIFLLWCKQILTYT